MPRKATKKVEKKIDKEEKVEKKDQYFYAIGRRKESIAQVRIYPVEKATFLKVNERDFKNYFTIARLQNVIESPISGSGQSGKFDISAKVSGGGLSGQADAVKLGIARALVKFDSSHRKMLKDLGFLKRDSREVERKKAGLKKARRAPQWAKR